MSGAVVHATDRDHQHQHQHPHPHEHRHVPEAGAVLDIGGSVGALLVTCPPDLEDAEIQLYDARGALLTHTEVHRRTTAGGLSYAGLFPALTAGEYRVELRPGERRSVRVEGGKVAVVDARRP
jgi:hypothetical protein